MACIYYNGKNFKEVESWSNNDILLSPKSLELIICSGIFNSKTVPVNSFIDKNFVSGKAVYFVRGKE